MHKISVPTEQIMDRAVKEHPVATECIVFRLFNISSLGVPWWRTQVYLMFPTVNASQQTAAQSQLLPSKPLRFDHSFASQSFIWSVKNTRLENGSAEGGRRKREYVGKRTDTRSLVLSGEEKQIEKRLSRGEKE